MWSGTGPSDPPLLLSPSDDFEVISDGEGASHCNGHDFERGVESPNAKLQQVLTPPTGSTHVPVTPSLGWSPSGAGDVVNDESEPIARELSFSQAELPVAPSSSLASTTTTTTSITGATLSCMSDATLPYVASPLPPVPCVPSEPKASLASTGTAPALAHGDIAKVWTQREVDEMAALRITTLFTLRERLGAKLPPALIPFLEPLPHDQFATFMIVLGVGFQESDFTLLSRGV